MVSLVSVDCAAPWWLRVNSALSWYHYTNPLLLLLLYYTVASICRVKVHTHTSTQARTHAHMHACKHACTHARMHAGTQKQKKN